MNIYSKQYAMPGGYALTGGDAPPSGDAQRLVDEIMAVAEVPSRRELRALPIGDVIHYVTVHPLGLAGLSRAYTKRKGGAIEVVMQLVSYEEALNLVATAPRGSAIRQLHGEAAKRWVPRYAGERSKFEGPVNR